MAHAKKVGVGSVFGKWTVVDEFMGNPRWMCRVQCECGSTRELPASELTRKCRPSMSCGCNGSKFSHGSARRGKKTKEYMAWVAINARCSNPNLAQYDDYGGRGIRVCDRWRESFENFLEDIGPSPSTKHSVDRFPDRDGDYEPGNCRWATSKEQNRNKRNNIYIEIDGVKKSFAEWCDHFGVKYRLPASRWAAGVRDWKRLFTEPASLKTKAIIVEIGEIADSVRGWCDRFEINRMKVRTLEDSGISHKDAILEVYSRRFR